MPKVKTKVAGQGQARRPKTVVFRMGNRKALKGAVQMKTDDLIAAFQVKDNSRLKNKINTVLLKRGVDVYAVLTERKAAETAKAAAELAALEAATAPTAPVEV